MTLTSWTINASLLLMVVWMQRHKRWHSFALAMKGNFGIKGGIVAGTHATPIGTTLAAATHLGTGQAIKQHVITNPFHAGETFGHQLTNAVRPVWTNPVTRGITHIFTDIKKAL